MERRPPHLAPVRSKGMPPWLVAVLGVLLTIGVLAVWLVTNLPPDMQERAQESFEAGRQTGRQIRQRHDATAPAMTERSDSRR